MEQGLFLRRNMVQEQLALATIEHDLSLTQSLEGIEVAVKLKGKNIPSKEIPQFVEVAAELWDPEFKQAAYAGSFCT